LGYVLTEQTYFRIASPRITLFDRIDLIGFAEQLQRMNTKKS